jgi:ELWxxDGT repeat protein
MTTYRVLFNGYDSNAYFQLWSTDGSTVNTTLLMPADAQPGGLDPTDLVALPTVTVFAGSDAAGFQVLWSSNGTSAGTQPLTVTGASASGLNPTDITRFGNDALFEGTDSDGNQQLWITNGTGTGTHELTLGATGVGGVNPSDITAVGTFAAFNGMDASGLQQLYVTTGTAGGTQEITPAGASASGLDPQDIAQFGSLALFFGYDQTGAIGLWKTNGTLVGTSEIATNVGESGNLFNPTAIDVVGTIALFAGIGSTGNDELLVTNGTTVATILPAHDSAAGLQPSDITTFGTSALFSGVDSSGATGLWITNGTSGGTSEIGVSGANAAGVQPSDITVNGTVALFSGVDSSGGTDLWITNGTAAGTAKIAVSGADSAGVQPSDITVYGTIALFEGMDANDDGQLYSYNFATGTVSELVSDSAGPFGLDPSDLTVANVACYAAGTNIGTPGGEVAIEALRPGDAVRTIDAAGRPGTRIVRWVGRRRLDLAGHPDPDLVAPVRLRAGALGGGLPRRDLVLSPDHCLALSGCLVRAYRLVNGTSIVQERDRADVEYLHVELPAHALLLAEGVAAESYLDEGARNFFDPAATRAAPGSLAEPPARPGACLPFAPDDAFVAAIWHRLAQAGGARGLYARPGAPHELTVQARGRNLRPVLVADGRHLYAVPPATRRLRLVSAAARPTERHPWAEDRRRLGVAVRRVMLDGATALPLDGPALDGGWWPAETGARLRWTDGDATLHLPAGIRSVEIRLAG